MALPSVQMPATDPSDVVAIQIDTTSGGSTPVAIRGYVVDIGGYQASIKVTNTQVGEFTGNR